MNKIKKIMSFLLFLCLLSSCAKTRDEEINQYNDTSDSKPMYACYINSEQIFPEGAVTTYCYNGQDNFYAVWNDQKGKSFLVKIGEKNEFITELSGEGNNYSVNCIAIDNNGNIITLFNEYDKYSARIYGSKTSEEKNYEINDPHIYDLEDFLRCTYINGELFLYNFSTILKFDNNFKLSGEFVSDNYIEELIHGSDNKLYAASDNTLMEIDVNEMSILNTIEFEADLNCHYFFSGYGEYIVYAVDDVYIYGIRQDGTIDVLSNLANYGLRGTALYGGIVDTNGKIFFFENGEYGSSLSTLEFVPIDKNNERTKITITASDSVGNGFEQAVRSYNRLSKEYYVEFEYINSNETDDLINSFDKDILSGNKTGDILIFSTEIKNSYNNGLFEDIYNYIDNDNNIERRDFFPSALNAMETDGKLYGVWANFSINTYAVPTTYSDYTDITGIAEIIKNEPDKFVLAESPYSYTKSDILKMLVEYNFDLFVDRDSKKCDFNNDNMRSLINIAQTFTELKDNNYDEFENRFSDNKGVLAYITLRGVDDYIITRDAVIRSENYINVTGIPRLDGKKIHIISGEPLYMNSFSENKEAAWDFIKYYLNYNQNYNRPFSSAGIPVLQHIFYENMDYRLEYNRLLKEKNGDDYCEYYFNNCPLRLADKEDYNALLEIISSSEALTCDKDILNIIEEEAGIFFDGHISEYDLMEKIQNRSSIVVGEKY